jgi:hypothetical protein
MDLTQMGQKSSPVAVGQQLGHQQPKAPVALQEQGLGASPSGSGTKELP